MEKIISINNKSEGWQATLEVMDDPGWPKRLARAQRESKEGKWVTLEELTKRHAKRITSAKRRLG
jgi:hypothetical protein